MLRFIVVLVAGAATGGLVAAPVPPVPEAKTLVAGLSDPSPKVRDESASALRNRVDALPWLRRAARSNDKDTARRAAELLTPYEPKRQEVVARAIDACIRDGHIDLFMEWHHYWRPENKADLWPVGLRATKVGLDLFAKSCPPEATKRLEQSLTPEYKKDYFYDAPLAEMKPVRGVGAANWYVRTDRSDRGLFGATFASVAGPVHSPVQARVSRGRYLALGPVQAYGLNGTFIACDDEVWNVTDSGEPRAVLVSLSVIVCRGNFRGELAGEVRGTSVLLVDGDIDLLPTADEMQNCLIRASGEIRLPKDARPINCTIEAHSKNATAPYKFFELSDVGLSLADDEEGLVVTGVKADTPFGNCGVAKGDLIRAIDDVPAGHSEEFRKKLRRAMVRQGDCLITVARGDKDIDLPVFFPLPK